MEVKRNIKVMLDPRQLYLVYVLSKCWVVIRRDDQRQQ